MDREKIVIELNEYDYCCSDGCCCHHYGIETTINGVDLPAHNIDLETQLFQILEYLGYDIEIISKFNEEVCIHKTSNQE